MKKVGILYILGFLVGMATGLFIPLSTLFLESKGVSENIIGMISSTYFVAMVVGSIIFLKICRKTDAYKLVISALLLAVIAIFVFVNSTKIIAFFICMFVVGLGISFNFITIQNNLAQTDTDDKTKVTGIYAFFFAIGFAVSTALGTIMFSISTNLAFGAACVLLLIDMVIIYNAKLKLGNSDDKSSGSENKIALFFPFILGGYTYGFIENAFSAFYPIYLKDSYSLKFAGIVLGTFVLGGIVGMLPLSALPAKLGIYKACILFSIGALFSLALIVGTSQKLLFSLIAGACVCVIYPSTLAALNMERVSSDDVIWATGVYSMFYSIGSACGPFVTGFVMDFTHKGLFIVSGLLIGLFMIVHLVMETKMQLQRR